MKKFDFGTMSIRVWLSLLVASLLVMVFLVITLMNYTPQVKVLAQFFTPDAMGFNQEIETTTLWAPQEQLTDHDVIDEMFARAYVEARNEYIPDGYEMAYRWGGRGPVALMSTGPVFRAFLAQKGAFLEKIQENKATTSVDIVKIYRNGFVFTVDFDLWQFSGGQSRFAGRRRATLRFARTMRGSWNRFFVNPYGFRVTSYNETALRQ